MCLLDGAGPNSTVPPGQNHTVDRAASEELDRRDPVATFRDRFRIPADGPIYLDGNSLGRPSRAVVDAIAAGIEAWEGELVGGWSRWINLPMEVGDRLGVLLGAGPGQVVMCDSTTVNLFKLAYAALTLQRGHGCGRGAGRAVIVGDANDFPTDRYVLAGLAEAQGCELRLVESDPVNGVDLDDLRATLDERTALVCLSHVNYRSAARLDLAAVTSLAHDCGALVLLDLSHSAGAVPVGLDEAGVDFAVGCTYKYLNAGPGAPGYLYVRRDLAGRLRQPIQGWFGQRDQFEMGQVYEPALGVGRFLTGTPGVLGLLAVRAGVDLLLEAGLDRLWTKSRALTELLVELVSQRLETAGAILASPRDTSRRGAHVSITHPRAWPWCAALIEKGLVVPDFRTPDVMRLGPAPLYTRFVDVYDAVERIRDVAASDRADGPASEVRPRVT
jgi:kynureninase